jgi:serine/threonine protein kinase
MCSACLSLELSGEHAVLLAGGAADVTPLRAGILMPRYACTLSNIPPPMDASWALRVLSRMTAALHAVHAAGWVHGDVKPSNIFIDFAGEAWLGDYGSSRRMSDVDSYTGGTPAFQCADISVTERARFDRVCLAVTLCSAVGVLKPTHAPTAGWSKAAVCTALAELADITLKAALEALLVETTRQAAS